MKATPSFQLYKMDVSTFINHRAAFGLVVQRYEGCCKENMIHMAKRKDRDRTQDQNPLSRGKRAPLFGLPVLLKVKNWRGCWAILF